MRSIFSKYASFAVVNLFVLVGIIICCYPLIRVVDSSHLVSRSYETTLLSCEYKSSLMMLLISSAPLFFNFVFALYSNVLACPMEPTKNPPVLLFCHFYLILAAVIPPIAIFAVSPMAEKIALGLAMGKLQQLLLFAASIVALWNFDQKSTFGALYLVPLVMMVYDISQVVNYTAMYSRSIALWNVHFGVIVIVSVGFLYSAASFVKVAVAAYRNQSISSLTSNKLTGLGFGTLTTAALIGFLVRSPYNGHYTYALLSNNYLLIAATIGCVFWMGFVKHFVQIHNEVKLLFVFIITLFVHFQHISAFRNLWKLPNAQGWMMSMIPSQFWRRRNCSLRRILRQSESVTFQRCSRRAV